MKSQFSVNSNNQTSIIDPLITASDAPKLLNDVLITLAVWRQTITCIQKADEWTLKTQRSFDISGWQVDAS